VTDRFHSLVVVLEKDMRDDDAQPLMDCITQLRGVLSVSGVVADHDSHMAQERARLEYYKALRAVIFPEAKP